MATKTPDFSKVGDFLEKNSKPILYIVGGVVIIILAKKLLGGLFNKYPSDPSNIEITPSRLSITQAQAMQIAQNLFEAMNRLGTDEKTLFDSITPLNDEDLKLVCKVFGLRSYFGQGYGAIFGQDKSLQGWLKAELGGQDLEDMQALFIAKGQAF
jgi:hypothetical protein